jgi:hypothetical protein
LRDGDHADIVRIQLDSGLDIVRSHHDRNAALIAGSSRTSELVINAESDEQTDRESQASDH